MVPLVALMTFLAFPHWPVLRARDAYRLPSACSVSQCHSSEFKLACLVTSTTMAGVCKAREHVPRSERDTQRAAEGSFPM